MDEGVLRAKFSGSLVGTAVGDAVGAGFEGRRVLESDVIGDLVARRELLAYTDDTHMMIGVAESLVQKEGFDGEHMARVFIKNYEC